MAERGDSVNERVVRFGRGRSLCGVLSSAAARDGDVPGILLLNAGMVHRVGPSRLYVKLARTLAGNGFPVLRFDFAGVGDSGPRRDELRFERSGVEETQAAMDVLAEESSCRRFVLSGICSGAEMSFRTACADARVVGVVLLNAQRYVSEPDPEVIARITRRYNANYYWQVAKFDWRSWRKLLSGRSHYATLLSAVLSRVRRPVRVGSKLQADQSGDAAAFERLRGRDVRLLLVFSKGDWGLEYLRVVLGKRARELATAKNPRVEVIDGTDHIFTLLDSQERVQQLILELGTSLVRRPGADAHARVRPTPER